MPRPQASPRLLHHIFERTAAAFPDNSAIEIPPSGPERETQRFTYAEMNEQANRLARRLESFVGEDSIVGILLPRNSHHPYVAQLAVLKAGGAYTCMDPKFPLDRMRFILEDSHCVALLTTSAHRAVLAELQIPGMRVVDVETEEACPEGHGQTADPATPSSLCYVIYTSGTTGRPKGVLIQHDGIVNLILSDVPYFGLTPEDRVGQSSSLAYDSSVEEIWLAFGVGATLIPMDDDVVRLGPDLVPWLRKERLTVFCPPPTLLRTCPGADPSRELPDLRLLYVGGEELTRDLVDIWAPGRWIENGYGPTECTVTVVRGRAFEGREVTIGSPVVNNHVWVLDDELREVDAGAPGELCVGGEGLARGYLNQPELTRQKFVEHPEYGRIYRTGDLVRRLDSGDIAYMGRMDSQVQIRGYRVELSAIETRLCECAGVGAAACKVQSVGSAQQLVAFVVPDADGAPSMEHLRSELGKTLPDYMQPVHYSLLPQLPTSPSSGKLDRAALPHLHPEVDPEREIVSPRTEPEALVASAFIRHLPIPDGVSVEDDFFQDLGGNSLLAARVISTLRKNELTAMLTVRDLYEARTVAALAARVPATRATESPPTKQPGKPRAEIRVIPGSLVQALWLLVLLALGSNVAYWLGFHLLPFVMKSMGLIPSLLLAPWVGLGVAPVYFCLSLMVAVCAKKLLIGRYEAGSYPFLGGMYVRNWIVQRLVRLVPWSLVEGTVFKNTCLRALGARIGKNVHIHTGVDILAGGWDLLEIGDDVTLGRDVALKLVDYENQELVLGPITIGDRSTVDTRARLAPDTVMQSESCLTCLSMLPSHSQVPSGEMWDGVPASFKARTPPAPGLTSTGTEWSPTAHGMLLILMRYLLGILPAVPLLILCLGYVSLSGLNAHSALDWVFSPSSCELSTILALLGIVVSGFVLSFPAQALGVRLLGRIRPGVYSRWSRAWISMFLKGRAVEAAGNSLSGTLLWPRWLRLAGMRVGNSCEISSIMEVVPELVRVDEECFFADGIYLGGPQIHRGTVTCGTTSFSKNTFLGNHVVVPTGTDLPPDILLGICTVADQEQIEASSSWFGHPAFELPRREVVQADRSLTHDPTWYRYVTRLFWEYARFLLPVIPLLFLGLWVKTLSYWLGRQPGGVFHSLTLPLCTGLVALCLCLIVLSLKWLLLGRVREGQHPLWSCWCSRWDFLYVTWSSYARGPMGTLEGTLFLGWWLRAMGAGLGQRVVLGAPFAQVVDPDMLNFDDHATVSCMFQAHSFEDRVLKIAPVRIGKRCTVASGAVLLYGADVGNGTGVAANSVVMKHEALLPDRYYIGFPTRPGSPPRQE